jgi:hypothetical protein
LNLHGFPQETLDRTFTDFSAKPVTSLNEYRRSNCQPLTSIPHRTAVDSQLFDVERGCRMNNVSRALDWVYNARTFVASKSKIYRTMWAAQRQILNRICPIRSLRPKAREEHDWTHSLRGDVCVYRSPFVHLIPNFRTKSS